MSDHSSPSIDEGNSELIRRIKDDQMLSTIIHRLPPEELEHVFKTFSNPTDQKDNKKE